MAGGGIADPTAVNNRAVIMHGRFWQRGARVNDGEGEKGGREKAGGYRPAATYTAGNLDAALTAAFYDRGNIAEPARGGIIRGNVLGGGIINASLDSLTTTPAPFVGYMGTPTSGTLTGVTSTSMAGTMTVPKVTYSYSAQSKSYSPASLPKMLGKQ
jgi:hypothetical protein